MSQTLAFANSCLHCGTNVPEREISGFCCRGCESVFGFLKERGLDAYYSLRDLSSVDERPKLPASAGSGDLSYLDDPEFLADYATDDGREMKFYLEGVHCAACVWLTEKLPELAPGVESLRLDLSSGVAVVRVGEGGRFAVAAFELSRLGYQPHPVRNDESDALRKKEDRTYLVRLGVAGMAAGNIMLLAVALYAGATGGLGRVFLWTSFVLYLPVFLYSALPFYRSAWASLRRREVSIDVPIVLGLLVGTGASLVNLLTWSPHVYFDSLSTLVFLLLATRYLLRKVNQHALSATRLMHFLVPSRAHRLDPLTSVYEEVRTDALREGDLVRVLPGECFPVDGVVTSGESAVDCALLTGESVPSMAVAGSQVNAGTWNRQAPLEIRVSASGAKTRLGRVMEEMKKGAAAKAPIVSYLDRVGQMFVGAVLALTLLGFFLGLSTGWHEAISRALAVAIVVCPCTFALATPLAMSLAISRLARAGILVKGPEVLERLSHVETVFFDKTGTLTEGRLQVSSWSELRPGATRALLALESHSAHPIAQAVKHHFKGSPESQAFAHVTAFDERAGRGVSGYVDGALHEARSLDDGESSDTRVGLYREGVLVGALTLADELRPDSRETIERLREQGVGVHLLSGDSARPVRRIASLLGIPFGNVMSAATPEAKANVVRDDPTGLMVGDGANDAVALASAYASVAVRGGMEVSLRAAGAYSSRPGIGGVPSLLLVARETFHVIRRNLVFAVFYNIVGVTVALSGHLDPLFAAVLMPLSALTVTASTLIGTRLLRGVS